MTITEAQLRILVSDRIPNNVLDSVDYTAIIAMETNLYRAAALVAQSIAAYFATKIDTTVGPVKIQNSQKFKHYTDLAGKLEKRATSGKSKDDAFLASGGGAPVLTGVSNTEIDTAHEDTDRYKPAFKRGDLDNPSGSDDIVDPTIGEY